MKKNILTLLAIMALFACSNSKSVEKTTTETKTVADAVPTPMEMPNDVGTETVENAGVRNDAVEEKATIEWLDFETAIDRNEKEPKYIFIDLYTEWCGWCKRMDASTFIDPSVVAFITENCYAVKMDAEMKEAIAYKGNLYEYKQFTAKAGYNTLAVSLLDSKMSFPSFVILGKKEAKVGKIMGYKTPEPFLIALKQYVK